MTNEDGAQGMRTRSTWQEEEEVSVILVLETSNPFEKKRRKRESQRAHM